MRIDHLSSFMVVTFVPFSDWSKLMFYNSIKHRKSVSFNVFSPPLHKFLLEMGKNIFFEKNCDGVLCEAAESFKEEHIAVFYGVNLSIWVFWCFYSQRVRSIYLGQLTGKCRIHSPAAPAFSISLVFWNARRVLLRLKLKLLYLFNNNHVFQKLKALKCFIY